MTADEFEAMGRKVAGGNLLLRELDRRRRFQARPLTEAEREALGLCPSVRVARRGLTLRCRLLADHAPADHEADAGADGFWQWAGDPAFAVLNPDPWRC